MKEQVMEYASGNEMAAIAVRQLGYDLMGYYPITPSTQIAEQLDAMRAEGSTDLIMVAAEGEHSAAGICYGASVGGGRVFNATSANGLLYAIEQLPVQSGTRYPMVMNVACRTVSGPLSIKGDHSDIMYMLNAGWIIFFAHTVQQVYDFNVIALKLAEQVRLPAVVAFDGFFTSHQKRRCYRFTKEEDVRLFIGDKKEPYPFLDLEHPITVGSYMNEPDLIHNRYQLHLAMEEARAALPVLFQEYRTLSGREYGEWEGYQHEDADTLLILLGSSYDTAKEAVNRLRKQGERVGILTLHLLRPFPAQSIAEACKNASHMVVADRQDSYGAEGGNLAIEIRAALQKYGRNIKVKNLVYGLGGKDFFVEDAIEMLHWAREESDNFRYFGVEVLDGERLHGERPNSDKVVGRRLGSDELSGEGRVGEVLSGEGLNGGGLAGRRFDGRETRSDGDTSDSSFERPFFEPLTVERTRLGCAQVEETENGLLIKGCNLNATTAMPERLAPGHGACPGCGIPVNLNLLLRAIEDPVVLLFQTGCGMIVTTPYPKTSFKVPYLHNLFQNGAATLSGLAEICYRKQTKGELPPGDILFIMVSGDGGLDIGMGSALGTALRGHRLLIFEYDNGGYMNTGYQLSYSTPKGAKSATSHVGKEQYGKPFFHKDMPQIMAAANIPYVATVAESNPMDFMKKAVKAATYAKTQGVAYVKALSACPLNWNDNPATERKVIEAAVDCCYFPLYEVEQGNTRLSYDPERTGKKRPVLEWLGMMGRTKHLASEEYTDIVNELQEEIDNRFGRLKAKAEHPFL